MMTRKIINVRGKFFIGHSFIAIAHYSSTLITDTNRFGQVIPLCRYSPALHYLPAARRG